MATSLGPKVKSSEPMGSFLLRFPGDVWPEIPSHVPPDTLQGRQWDGKESEGHAKGRWEKLDSKASSDVDLGDTTADGLDFSKDKADACFPWPHIPDGWDEERNLGGDPSFQLADHLLIHSNAKSPDPVRSLDPSFVGIVQLEDGLGFTGMMDPCGLVVLLYCTSE